jgi:hypothetical protein
MSSTARVQDVTPTPAGEAGGRLAMIDSGNSGSWTPSSYMRNVLGRTTLDYLFITNADQDHMSDLQLADVCFGAHHGTQGGQCARSEECQQATLRRAVCRWRVDNLVVTTGPRRAIIPIETNGPQLAVGGELT